jgi:mono/diheme cytochrome c family protein
MMTKRVRSNIALAAILALAGGAGFAQSGSDTYKAKCASCHGATGMAESGAGKAMKVKPANDPDVKAMSEADMIKVTTDGKGKMPAFKGKITDAQIKDSVGFYRSLGK